MVRVRVSFRVIFGGKVRFRVTSLSIVSCVPRLIPIDSARVGRRPLASLYFPPTIGVSRFGSST
jgi:hypothetical protein